MKKIQGRYLVSAGLILLLIFVDKYAITQNQVFGKANYESSDTLLLISLLAKMAIGIVLAFPYLYTEKRKTGKWRVRLGLVMFAAIPCFYLANPYFAKSQIEVISAIHHIFLRPNYRSYLSIFQIIFGYVMGKSFYKEAR